jgi:hypothetical protein
MRKKYLIALMLVFFLNTGVFFFKPFSTLAQDMQEEPCEEEIVEEYPSEDTIGQEEPIEEEEYEQEEVLECEEECDENCEESCDESCEEENENQHESEDQEEECDEGNGDSNEKQSKEKEEEITEYIKGIGDISQEDVIKTFGQLATTGNDIKIKFAEGAISVSALLGYLIKRRIFG